MKKIALSLWVGHMMLLAGCAGWAPYYQIDPIHARVVDEETGKPIVGANVVAHWQLVIGGLDGPSDHGQLEVKETVTDEEGRFSFEGFTRLNLIPFVELRDDDPEILIFKSGYDYVRAANEYPRAGTLTPGIHRRWPYNGKTLELRKLPENAEYPYAGLGSSVLSVMEGCGWERIPRFTAAMITEEKRLQILRPHTPVDLIDVHELKGPPGCGSPDDLVDKKGDR